MLKSMFEWLSDKMRKHQYISIGMTETYGMNYRCLRCGRRLYVPWGFSHVDVKKLRGCKGRR